MKNTLKTILAIMGIAVVMASCAPKSETAETDGQDTVQVVEEAPVAEPDTVASDSTVNQ